MQTTANSIKTVYKDAGAKEFNNLAVTLLNVVSNLFKAQDDQNEMLLGYGKCQFFEFFMSDFFNTRFPFLTFLKYCLSQIVPLVSFYTPLKTSQNQRFFDVFRGYRTRQVAWNGLMQKACT